MIHEERLEQILALLEKNGSISVNDLKAQLYVSTATIRRDLAELSRRGLIARSFGGAVSISRTVRKLPTALDEQPENPFGRAAVSLIQDGNTIFIASGELSHTLAPYLGTQKHLTAVTNDSELAIFLTGRVRHVYCTGGRALHEGGLFIGQKACETASGFRYDVAFFSCGGLGPHGELLYDTMEEASLLSTVVQCTRRRVLICPNEKICDRGRCAPISLREIDTVITDNADHFGGIFQGSIISVS